MSGPAPWVWLGLIAALTACRVAPERQWTTVVRAMLLLLAAVVATGAWIWRAPEATVGGRVCHGILTLVFAVLVLWARP
jgi:hypothetical protein